MSRRLRWACSLLAVLAVSIAADAPNARKPVSEAALRKWLENMVRHHRFTTSEIEAATGLNPSEIASALKRFEVRPEERPARPADAPLLVLPYPGGRHPRIGFLEGAINPQRETKISVFTPWDPSSYVVADVPEAIWSNLGLTYLAHTHVPTIWTKQAITLPTQEWQVQEDGSLVMERTLPNGITFGTKVIPGRDGVRMRQWLTNGTSQPLSDLRVQNCVMLKAAQGFNTQTNENKVFRPPYVACRSEDGRRWVITAWKPNHRCWGNAPCPCLHSDPKFPDCPPGQTRRLNGWLSFHEGTAIDEELNRIDALHWDAPGPG